ncbi:unnamed protein product [Timema podura]|uniref:Uncharacterized protein n=1 Tax=Timema podura TaxID=61482 RepID=A0ABN7NUP5_TIMPD|nr:unnamed protein product [Timema podura]
MKVISKAKKQIVVRMDVIVFLCKMSQCKGFSIQDMLPEVVLNSVHEFTNALVKLNPTYTGMWVLKSIFGIPQLVLDSVELTVSYIAWHGMVWLETKVLASPKMKEALNESNDYWKVLFAVNHLLEFGNAIKFMDRWLPMIKTRDPKIFLKDFIDMTFCTPVGDYDDLLQIFDTIGLESAGKLKKLKEFSEIKKDMILDDDLFILAVSSDNLAKKGVINRGKKNSEYAPF